MAILNDEYITRSSVPYCGVNLAADRMGPLGNPPLLCLHGGGAATKERFHTLRCELSAKTVPTLAFDFLGHGETGGNLENSSLEDRTEQVRAVVQYFGLHEPLDIVASSMSAYSAIKLTKFYRVRSLTLFVPAVYTFESYSVPFGTSFSAIIRKPDSWKHSDAWHLMSDFSGRLLVIVAAEDEVVSPAIPAGLIASATNASSVTSLAILGSGHQIMKHLSANEDQLGTVVDAVIANCVPAHP